MKFFNKSQKLDTLRVTSNDAIDLVFYITSLNVK